MHPHTSVTTNIIKYAGIYQEKLSTEYARFLDISDAVHSIKSLYKLLSDCRDKEVFRILSKI